MKVFGKSQKISRKVIIIALYIIFNYFRFDSIVTKVFELITKLLYPFYWDINVSFFRRFFKAFNNRISNFKINFKIQQFVKHYESFFIDNISKQNKSILSIIDFIIKTFLFVITTDEIIYQQLIKFEFYINLKKSQLFIIFN